MGVVERRQDLLDELGGIETKLKELRHGTTLTAYSRIVNQQTYDALVKRQAQVRDELAQLYRRNYDPFGAIRTQPIYMDPDS